MNTFIYKFIRYIVPRGKRFLVLSISELEKKITGKYDYIVLINVLEHERDIISYLEKLSLLLLPNGRVVIVYNNYLYAYFMSMFGGRRRHLNWLSRDDIKTFLRLSNFTLLVSEPLLLFPWPIPILSSIFNRFLLFFFPFNHLSLIHYMIFKKSSETKPQSVSILIAARNEEGNIKNIFAKLPSIGTRCEVIFIEGNSADNTRQEIRHNIQKHAGKSTFVYKLVLQKNQGKADAIHLGIAHSTGSVVIIYDADMTVNPRDLHKFYLALISGKGEFINGSRLVYPIEQGAMQSLNILGNKFFSLLFTFFFSQPIKDTLCGTKAFFRSDYDLFERQRMSFLKKADPFGDFYLLYGAKKLNLDIVDVPVRYYARTYGSTNIHRFGNAFELLKFSFICLWTVKMRL